MKAIPQVHRIEFSEEERNQLIAALVTLAHTRGYEEVGEVDAGMLNKLMRTLLSCREIK